MMVKLVRIAVLTNSWAELSPLIERDFYSKCYTLNLAKNAARPLIIQVLMDAYVPLLHSISLVLCSPYNMISFSSKPALPLEGFAPCSES